MSIASLTFGLIAPLVFVPAIVWTLLAGTTWALMTAFGTSPFEVNGTEVLLGSIFLYQIAVFVSQEADKNLRRSECVQEAAGDRRRMHRLPRAGGRMTSEMHRLLIVALAGCIAAAAAPASATERVVLAGKIVAIANGDTITLLDADHRQRCA